MRRILPAAVLTLTALTLSGCMQSAPTAEGPDEDAATSETTQPAETSSPEASADTSAEEVSEGEVSERGNTEAAVGDTATIASADDPENPVMTFTVTDIEMDPTCTGDYPQDAENGHFLAVDIEAETGSAEQFEELLMGQDLQFNPNFFQFITSDGMTANVVTSAPAYGCLPQAEYLTDTIGPSEKVSGTVLLDVPDSTGTLVFEEPITGTSWEWDVPSK